MKNRGFTVIELLTVIAILAILATLAAPSFATFITKQKLRSASYDLHSTLIFARNEAMKRNQNVNIVPATASDWSQGWTVTTSPNITLRSEDSRSGIGIAASPTAIATSGFAYRRDGRTSTGSTITFTLTASGQDTRCIRIDSGGTPSSRILTNGGTC